jgi:hypothetical protein
MRGCQRRDSDPRASVDGSYVRARRDVERTTHLLRPITGRVVPGARLATPYQQGPTNARRGRLAKMSIRRRPHAPVCPPVGASSAAPVGISGPPGGFPAPASERPRAPSFGRFLDSILGLCLGGGTMQWMDVRVGARQGQRAARASNAPIPPQSPGRGQPNLSLSAV